MSRISRRRRSILGALLAATLVPLPLAAQDPARTLAERARKAELRLAADRTAYEPGSRARLAALVEIEPGWHVNSHWPSFDYLIPTELSLTPPAGWSAAAPRYPPGEMQTFSFEKEPLSVYEGQVTIFTDLELPAGAAAGPAALAAVLRYQACDDRSCLPPTTAEASLELVVGPGGRAANQGLFAAGAREGAARLTARLPLILLLGLVGGLILNAMPCVLPVLSLKLFGLVQSAAGGRGAVVTGSLATAAGILLSFWALAAAAILARSAGAAVGWGVQFQEPSFVAFLTVVVLLFSLNLWGLFEIPLPGLVTRLTGGEHRAGIPGHFVSGLFATLMATPCSAPFLGTAVGFALSQPGGVILATFTAVGLGMALPYLVLAITPRAVALLPRPGPWMGHFKVVMGFLLAGAAVWLLYVMSAQMTAERLAFIELALLVLALFAWLRGRSTRPLWRRVALTGALLAVAGTLVLAGRARGRTDVVTGSFESRLISWVAFDRPEAERLASEEGRMVFVDVTADWCFTCKVNERLVLETPEVAELFERHGVVPMKADWTNRSDAIAAFLADHGRYGIPFYLLYRPGAEPLLLPELLTREILVQAVEEAAAARERGAGRPPEPGTGA